jgi:hypothetical protein
MAPSLGPWGPKRLVCLALSRPVPCSYRAVASSPVLHIALERCDLRFPQRAERRVRRAGLYLLISGLVEKQLLTPTEEAAL